LTYAEKVTYRRSTSPLGATGAILVVKALYELRRITGRYALVTMCIGGGQGIAAIFERA
jgi:acetyl-CoA C-acetyltransferase